MIGGISNASHTQSNSMKKTSMSWSGSPVKVGHAQAAALKERAAATAIFSGCGQAMLGANVKSTQSTRRQQEVMNLMFLALVREDN